MNSSLNIFWKLNDSHIEATLGGEDAPFLFVPAQIQCGDIAQGLFDVLSKYGSGLYRGTPIEYVTNDDIQWYQQQELPLFFMYYRVDSGGSSA